MDASHGPYSRRGEPGGPGCRVAGLEIAFKGPDGLLSPAVLLDAGNQATEVELLRTVAQLLGIRWGQDELGWWAAVPRSTELQLED